MSQQRIGRINEEIQKELASQLRNLKDPRIQNAMISVTAVETTPDLRYAKVFVSVLQKDREKDVLKGLKSARGFLRRQIGATLQLRYTPELIFHLDESLEKGIRMYELLSSLHVNDVPEDENESSEG